MNMVTHSWLKDWDSTYFDETAFHAMQFEEKNGLSNDCVITADLEKPEK